MSRIHSNSSTELPGRLAENSPKMHAVCVIVWETFDLWSAKPSNELGLQKALICQRDKSEMHFGGGSRVSYIKIEFSPEINKSCTAL